MERSSRSEIGPFLKELTCFREEGLAEGDLPRFCEALSQTLLWLEENREDVAAGLSVSDELSRLDSVDLEGFEPGATSRRFSSALSASFEPCALRSNEATPWTPGGLTQTNEESRRDARSSKGVFAR